MPRHASTNSGDRSMYDFSKFTCGVCSEELDGVRIAVSNDYICENCFKTRMIDQFERALESEARYPVKWGALELTPLDFPAYLPYEFRLAWVIKVREYRTPVEQRVYCAHVKFENADGTVQAICDTFLGKKIPLGKSTSDIKCEECNKSTCAQCFKPLLAEGHVCGAGPEADPFEGTKLGKDYQICPKEGCNTKLALLDGCNAMTCKYCDTEFCYICGQRAAAGDGTGHWDAGKPCPRFGDPGNSNALHDEPLTDNEMAIQEADELLDDFEEFDVVPEGILLQRDILAIQDMLLEINALQQHFGGLQNEPQWLRAARQFGHFALEHFHLYVRHRPLGPLEGIDINGREVPRATPFRVRHLRRLYNRAGQQGQIRWPQMLNVSNAHRVIGEGTVSDWLDFVAAQVNQPRQDGDDRVVDPALIQALINSDLIRRIEEFLAQGNDAGEIELSDRDWTRLSRSDDPQMIEAHNRLLDEIEDGLANGATVEDVEMGESSDESDDEVWESEDSHDEEAEEPDENDSLLAADLAERIDRAVADSEMADASDVEMEDTD